MAEQWNEYVNTKFYGQDGSYGDNTEEIEFKSGRKISYLKDSEARKTHALSLRLKDKGTPKINGRTEFEWFLYWYENTIKSGTKSFELTDIITGTGTKTYRLQDKPKWNGLKYKEISLTIEEV